MLSLYPFEPLLGGLDRIFVRSVGSAIPNLVDSRVMCLCEARVHGERLLGRYSRVLV